MATASPSIGVIRAQIRAIRNKAPDAKVFGIFAPGRWTGPPVHGDGGAQIAIYQCDSPLQMRLALQEAPATASATVLVTPLDQSRISDDVLIRLALRRMHPINSWEIVRSLFRAKHLDPRITRHPFLADLLLEHAGGRDFQPVAGGLIDADTVWGILLTERLGLSGAHPDAVELLRASAESDLVDRWNVSPYNFREAASEWIRDTAGEVAGAMLRCFEGEHGRDALSLGSVMGVVYHDAVGHELDKAGGRLEAYIGTVNFPIELAKRWRDAAMSCASQVSKLTLRRSLDAAEQILEHIGASSHAWRSDELDSGFEQRLSRLGQALAAHVDTRATVISAELQRQYLIVGRHRRGLGGGRRMERIAMAIRLSRWLADQNARGATSPSDLLAISEQYAGDGGFVDWARHVLRGGEPNKDLAAAFVRLVDCVTEIREAENERFGRALVERRAVGAGASCLIPIEQVIDQVVVRVAEKAPMLLLLVDGMSWAVFRELVADIKAHDWVELGFTPAPRRPIGLAALPSVTEVGRTSLFCGTLRRGQANDEVQGFAAHAGLVGVSSPANPPKLFHKAALEGDEDTSLAAEIRHALADKKQRVVGIVINAVDDHLDKGDQIDAIWTTQHVRVLQPILAEAGAAGRMVVLLSDHGHVLDRQTEGRDGSDGLRWRRPDGGVAPKELEVTSPRVVVPIGGRVVVPWSERLRYGAKKNGYHGGATPQEMLIPITVLWRDRRVPADFEEMSADLPSWWTEPMVAAAVPSLVTPAKVAQAKPTAPTLFDQPKAPPSAVTPEEPWIKALLQSDVLAVQRQQAGRARMDDALFQRCVAALLSRGGSMTTLALAGAIGVPEHRLPGLLAIMQRLLNVEGYAVLDRQEASNTVVLNVALLKRQFELE